MSTSNFNFIFLGQTVLRYKTPAVIQHAINSIYETKINSLPPANKQLVGKINKEHSLFYNGNDETKMKKHQEIPGDVLQWFLSKFTHYLTFNKIRHYEIRLNSVWVNEMKEH